jgi:hypothetical protein
MLTRTPSTFSTVSSISMRLDALHNGSLYEEPILEDASTVPSLLSSLRSSPLRAVCLYPVLFKFDETYVIPQISPAQIPVLRSPSLLSMPTAIVRPTLSEVSFPLLLSPHVRRPSDAPPERSCIVKPTYNETDRAHPAHMKHQSS